MLELREEQKSKQEQLEKVGKELNEVKAKLECIRTQQEEADQLLKQVNKEIAQKQDELEKYKKETEEARDYKEKIENIKLLEGLTLKENKNEVIIANVAPNSYPAMIGLEKGDVILKVKTLKTGKWVKIISIDELKKLLKDLDKGDALIEIKRDNAIFIIQM